MSKLHIDTREMKRRTKSAVVFTLGDWTVRPAMGFIERHGERIRLEPKLFDVLACLANEAGGVVSVDQLLESCWAGSFYGDNPVHKAIALLRRALGDEARSPRYIATIRKRGYRLLAPVVFMDDTSRQPMSERREPYIESPQPFDRSPWPGPADNLLELARAMDAMGRILLRMSRFDAAANYFSEAIALKNQVFHQWPGKERSEGLKTFRSMLRELAHPRSEESFLDWVPGSRPDSSSATPCESTTSC